MIHHLLFCYWLKRKYYSTVKTYIVENQIIYFKDVTVSWDQICTWTTLLKMNQCLADALLFWLCAADTAAVQRLMRRLRLLSSSRNYPTALPLAAGFTWDTSTVGICLWLRPEQLGRSRLSQPNQRDKTELGSQGARTESFVRNTFNPQWGDMSGRLLCCVAAISPVSESSLRCANHASCFPHWVDKKNTVTVSKQTQRKLHPVLLTQSRIL